MYCSFSISKVSSEITAFSFYKIILFIMSGEDVCGLYKRSTTTVLTNHPLRITDKDSQVSHPQNREELLGGNVVPHTPPRFDKHSIEEHRLSSFKDKAWPIGLTQSPEELARAGFYYLGRATCLLIYDIIRSII